MSAPSDKAIDAAYEALADEDKGETGYYDDAEDALRAAHDSKLGLDRSVCLRDVVELVRGVRATGWDYPAPHPSSDLFAGIIEQHFTDDK